MKTASVNGKNIEYILDAYNRRVGKKVNGALTQGFIYQTQTEISAELDGNNQVVSIFAYGPKRHVPAYFVKGAQSTWYSIVSDNIGSVRLVIEMSTGNVVQEMDYDEFGNVIKDTNPGFQPFGYAGGLYDRDTGLARFGARDYDAETGRWTSKDPLLFGGGDTNLFGYVENDPINFIDPMGEMKLPANPGGLPPGWHPDPSHKDPNGERWRYKDTDRYLDYHKGRPGQKGWKAKDHWHDSEGGEKCPDHLEPGDEVPDPVDPLKNLLKPPFPGPAPFPFPIPVPMPVPIPI